MFPANFLQAPASDACALARFKTCSQGEPLCAALTLGNAASAEQRAAGRDYNDNNCQSDSPLDVELVFAGEMNLPVKTTVKFWVWGSGFFSSEIWGLQSQQLPD
jgi:hypothetical protein